MPYGGIDKKSTVGANMQMNALWKTSPDFYFRQPCLCYQPHLLVNFKAALETGEKIDELHCLSINL
jgi:hypothetical protein